MQFVLIAATCTTTGNEGSDFGGCAAITVDSKEELTPKFLQVHPARPPGG
jgi:hypothetical protein